VGEHESFERAVQVRGQSGDERVVGIHRAPEPEAAASRCICARGALRRLGP
jgi:hypothetical protein